MDAREKKQMLLDSRYLRMTQIWAENSYCRRRQVGALLVKDKMIISDGYNGTPMAPHYTSPHRLVWNAASSSFKLASGAWYLASITACMTVWTCCAVPASRLSTCGSMMVNTTLCSSQAILANRIIRK